MILASVQLPDESQLHLTENGTWHGENASAVEWANAITRAVVDDDSSDPIRRIVLEVTSQIGAVAVFVAAVGDEG